MENLKKLFLPQFLEKTSIRAILVMSLVQLLIFACIAQFNGNELIPKPTKVLHSAMKIISSPGFLDNFVATLWLIVKSMTIAIGVSLIFVYASLIPAYKGISVFVSKLRFLTYTGLVFVFTILVSNGGQIKMSLLLFGIIPYFVTSLLSYIHDPNDKSYRKEYELCCTLKYGRWRTLYEVIIKGKLHLVLEVIRQNFAICWMMITSVEGICMSEGGLGTMMLKSNKYMKMDEVFSILLIILLVGIMFDYLFDLLKVWLFPYTDTKRANKLWIKKIIKSN
jgi:ABC-type nitrate/sulfonate/bicarbonate transport system permease component